MFGSKVRVVNKGSKILKDVINEVMCDWSEMFEYIFYFFGIVVGFYLFLIIVKYF